MYIENNNGNIVGLNNIGNNGGNVQFFANNISRKFLCAFAFGSDIINEIAHLLRLGDKDIEFTYPNRFFFCNLGSLSE